MADVALRAGVSRTLVSFILSGKPGASEETRRRVLEVADEIGYRPDSAAQLLARGRSCTIGVLVDVRQPFQAERVTVIYPAVESVGYEALLNANLPDRDESVSIDALIIHRCGGLICWARPLIRRSSRPWPNACRRSSSDGASPPTATPLARSADPVRCKPLTPRASGKP